MDIKTINKLKIATNIILALLLLSVLLITLFYKQDVQEAMQLKEPDRLMKIYEDKTDTKCLCANPKFGNVIYMPTT